MANDENLLRPEDRTPKERRESARKAGKASGVARRKRKAMREQAELLLSMPFQDVAISDGKGGVKSLLKELEQASGLKADEIDNQMAAIIAMWQTALRGGQNSVQAFNSIRDLVGEKPKEVIEIHSTDETIKELDKIIGEKKGKKE